MRKSGNIDYIELPGGTLPATKDFYAKTFGWTFTDYGPDYSSFNEGLDGGFHSAIEGKSDKLLIVLYAEDLEEMEQRVKNAGAKIVRPIFSFPGGRRFHFLDPAGNELSVWSDK